MADTIPPVITLSGHTNMTVPFRSTYMEPGYSATDNVDGNITGSVMVSGSVNTGMLGTYTISYDVTDSSNNTAIQQNRIVHVVPDTVLPVITLHGNATITVPFGAAYAEPGYAAIDNVDGNITNKVQVTGSVNSTRLGTYTMSYDVTDSSGNAAVQQSRTVHVKDLSPPVITLSGQSSMTVPFGSKYVEPGYAAIDNIDGNITDKVQVTGSVNSTSLGTYTISYDVTDSSGNAAVQQSRAIQVVPDAVRPVITLHGNATVTVPFGAAYVEPGYAATDNIDGNITGKVQVTGSVNSTRLGTYTMSYDVTDSSGNAAVQQSRTVHVKDLSPPVITLSGPTEITMHTSERYVEHGYAATDNVDGDVTAKVQVRWSQTATPGVFTVSYDVADSAGNQAVQQTRTVTILR